MSTRLPALALPRRIWPAGGRPGWLPVWSADAGMRALRATIVVPGLFALTLEVIGDRQMALFAVFGGFATLLFASFGGSRRVRAIAHLGLAVTGSIALIIGTLVSESTWLAAVVTIPVAFAVFFAGFTGPNAASGVTAALLAYVLPVASAAPAATLGSRLAGWWLASAVSTAAVLLLSRRGTGGRLREAAAVSAAALAEHLTAAAAGRAIPAGLAACVAAKQELRRLFTAAPYRPTGLATADQALASIITTLEWCTALTADALDGHLDIRDAAPADRELLAASGGVLRHVAALMRGHGAPGIRASLARLDELRTAGAESSERMPGDPDRARRCAVHAVHAQTIALTVRSAAADALIAAGRARPATIAAERQRWYGARADVPGGPAGAGKLAAGRRLRWAGPALAGALGITLPRASLRSVWFRSSVRGAAALALAVLVADLSGVQHGFWVVLGTLSVLRANAAATGATALRALAGTVAGFAVGGGLLAVIGTSPAALWTVLPLAVLVASYAPGTAPFPVGQAAFTVAVVVLFNLLVPDGWQVGLLRVQDVAIGCVVSVTVGALFWPHGASGVVGADLADAFRRGAEYLTQAVDWALGRRAHAPDTGVATVTAGIRLDDALRGYLAEQGAKRMAKADLWDLVAASTRLRLTAYSLASLPAQDGKTGKTGPVHGPGGPSPEWHDAPRLHPHDPGLAGLRRVTAELAGFYTRIAAAVGSPGPGAPQPLAVPELDFPRSAAVPPCADDRPAQDHPRTLWVSDHLHHLGDHARAITGPAGRLARQRRARWWR